MCDFSIARPINTSFRKPQWRGRGVWVFFCRGGVEKKKTSDGTQYVDRSVYIVCNPDCCIHGTVFIAQRDWYTPSPYVPYNTCGKIHNTVEDYHPCDKKRLPYHTGININTLQQHTGDTITPYHITRVIP